MSLLRILASSYVVSAVEAQRVRSIAAIGLPVLQGMQAVIFSCKYLSLKRSACALKFSARGGSKRSAKLGPQTTWPRSQKSGGVSPEQ